MKKLVSRPPFAHPFVSEDGVNIASAEYAEFFDDIQTLINQMLSASQVQLPEYTVTTLPNATTQSGGMVYVSDESGGAVPAFTDGVNWRRITDRAIVS